MYGYTRPSIVRLKLVFKKNGSNNSGKIEAFLNLLRGYSTFLMGFCCISIYLYSTLGGLISGMFHPILGGNSWHFTWICCNRIGNNPSQKWGNYGKLDGFYYL